MAFATLSLASAQALLAARLADPGMVQWLPAELTRYLREALRTWQALTGSTRVAAVFNLTATPTTTFYDLPTVLAPQRAYTVLTTDLLTDLEYSLVEPITAPPWHVWAGTAQFALADLVQAVQERRDRFLSETRAVLTHRLLPLAPPPPTGRGSLSQDVLALNRLAWVDAATGAVTPLRRDDEWGLTGYRSGWPQQPGTPRVYSTSVTPPLQFQLAPPPLAVGTLDALVVAAGALVDPTIAAQTLDIPDDWTWVVKFGALADLLSRDGLALDVARAAYCEARWQQGLELAKAASVVLTARLDDIPMRVETVANVDSYATSWQTTPGQPRVLLTAGHTIVGVSPPPAVPPPALGPAWSITVDLVPNMPVPVNAPDYLQVSADVFDLVLDYAQHLAVFKLGDAQLEASRPLLDRFLTAAGVSLKRRLLWKPNRAVPHAPLPDDQWAPGTASAPVGVS